VIFIVRNYYFYRGSYEKQANLQCYSAYVVNKCGYAVVKQYFFKKLQTVEKL
jgi:hypothetical protein